jgi:hypothetical protein
METGAVREVERAMTRFGISFVLLLFGAWVSLGDGAARAAAASARLTVGVVVSRSCTVEARPAFDEPVRLKCANGAGRAVRLSRADAPTPASRAIAIDF